MTKLRLVVAGLISILPLKALRAFAYRVILGYTVRGAAIGFGTVIAVEEATLQRCTIGWFNLFAGPMSLTIKENASIGHRNTFTCGYWTTREEYREANYERRLEIGENSLITSNHYVDAAGAFTLGKGSWIAGMGSQFWTHGAGIVDRNIHIGEDCYLGSAVRFAPGASIGNNILVAMGSVVAGKFEMDNAMLGGVPAAVLKENYDWKTKDPHTTPN
ncbi:MAG: hypothetical protein GXP40_07620 [Chloroflexi bacterium]|nr:hypothetical protein [Chloroflexota bacterium]